MSQKHRILVVGVGSIGERHLRCFQSTGRAEMMLCEMNPQLRETVAERYGNVPTFPDFESAIEEDFTAAIVATPANLHVPMSTMLAERGRHVLCEKPLSSSLDGVVQLSDVVAATGVTFVMGYTWRSNPVMRSFKSALDSGRYGTPRQMVYVGGQHWPHYRPAYRVVPYFQRRETGGGVVQDALTHMMNLGEWFLGPITHVTGDHAHLLLEGITMEDTAHVIARHGNVLASYSTNLTQMPAEGAFTIVTDTGTLRIEESQRRWRWMDTPAGQWHDESIPDFNHDVPYIDQAHAFLDAVEGKGPIRCTLDEGISTLKVNLAVLQAADHHRWETPG